MCSEYGSLILQLFVRFDLFLLFSVPDVLCSQVSSQDQDQELFAVGTFQIMARRDERASPILIKILKAQF